MCKLLSFSKNLSCKFCHSISKFQTNLTCNIAPALQYPSRNLLSLLRKCKDMNHLDQIHALLITGGSIHNPVVATEIISLLSLNPFFHNVNYAVLIADQIEYLHSYTWNTIIRGCLKRNKHREAILIYNHLRNKGLEGDSHTTLFVIKACGRNRGVYEGKQIHGEVLKMGFNSELVIQTAMLQMYGEFYELDSSQKVFDEISQRDIVTWNALITADLRGNLPYKAILVFKRMVEENIKPNEVTVLSIISACSCLRVLREGKSMHGYLVRNFAFSDVIIYNGLIDFYGKCKCLLLACRIFNMMLERTVVSWTCMINCYCENDQLNEALALFRKMELSNVQPDEITMLSMISMCKSYGSLELGRYINEYIRKNGFSRSILIENSLIDMYAKCGDLEKACELFDTMSSRTSISWTTIINGLALHGQGKNALLRFCQMEREGFEPDGITFIGLLSACSHMGLIDEGWKCFESMTKDYGITPWMEHYGCVVDLLCRAGRLKEAFDFVMRMPIKPDSVLWRTLIKACKDQGNMDIARRIMDCLLENEPKYSGNYTLVSNLYAAVGEWKIAKEVRKDMQIKSVSKLTPAFSSIEVNSSHRSE